jgi:hypothetical protein
VTLIVARDPSWDDDKPQRSADSYRLLTMPARLKRACYVGKEGLHQLTGLVGESSASLLLSVFLPQSSSTNLSVNSSRCRGVSLEEQKWRRLRV